ncbi:MAG: hypothetical protein KZQ70_05925 [gamma proteobacterium symbiont of Lucinoma myriamae]|nr:hypothetical protein [gamma proteobacterium symbiont of Lucinoma myriamae]
MKRYLFLLFIIVNAVAYNFYDKKYTDRSNEYLANKLISMENQYVIASNTYDTYAQLIFRNNIQTDELYRIIKYLPHSSETQKNYIRNELYQYILSLYKDLKENIYARQIHFHLPDGKSFLRMHRPDKYGDQLFEMRPTIKEANLKLVEVKGFEEGRTFNAYRFVFPIIFNNEHFGSVEISVSMDAIIGYMKAISQTEYCFMIKKLIVSDNIFEDEKVNYEQSILSPWYLHDKVINDDFCTNQIASLLEIIKRNESDLEKIENSDKFATSIVKNKKVYTALFLPIKNTVNRNVAYLFSVNNDPLYKQFRINFITKILLSLISTFSFIFIIFFLFSKNQMIKNKNIKLEEQIKRESNALSLSHKKEQRDIIFFNIIKAINKKILCNTPLDDILKFCVNRVMTLPSCTFSVISVNLKEEYLFFSDTCDKFETDKIKICDTIFKLVRNSNNYSHEQPVIINDLSKISELAGYVDAFEQHQVRTIVFLPLIEEVSLKKFGHVIFFSARTECFDENERQLFSELSQAISFAISFNQTKSVATEVQE